MKRAFLTATAAGIALAVFSAQAADLGTTEEGFGAAAMVPDQALAMARAKGEDGSIGCWSCTADGTSNISGRAFQNAVGVFTVVQNTGNQVFLNTITVVNVSISK